jgi:hypothetical protein
MFGRDTWRRGINPAVTGVFTEKLMLPEILGVPYFQTNPNNLLGWGRTNKTRGFNVGTQHFLTDRQNLWIFHAWDIAALLDSCVWFDWPTSPRMALRNFRRKPEPSRIDGTKHVFCLVCRCSFWPMQWTLGHRLMSRDMLRQLTGLKYENSTRTAHNRTAKRPIFLAAFLIHCWLCSQQCPTTGLV